MMLNVCSHCQCKPCLLFLHNKLVVYANTAIITARIHKKLWANQTLGKMFYILTWMFSPIAKRQEPTNIQKHTNKKKTNPYLTSHVRTVGSYPFRVWETVGDYAKIRVRWTSWSPNSSSKYARNVDIFFFFSTCVVTRNLLEALLHATSTTTTSSPSSPSLRPGC